MVDVGLLKNKIEESGIKITVLADKMGVSRDTFYNRLETPMRLNCLKWSVYPRHLIFPLKRSGRFFLSFS